LCLIGEAFVIKHLIFICSFYVDTFKNSKCYFKVRFGLAGQIELALLLHGRFQFYDVTAPNLHARNLSVTHPFLLAASFGALKSCDILIKNDVSVIFATEPECLMNVVHCLVGVVVYDPVLEPVMVQTYKHLCSMLPVGEVKRLLEMENSCGYRPLEFAVQQVSSPMLTR